MIMGPSDILKTQSSAPFDSPFPVILICLSLCRHELIADYTFELVDVSGTGDPVGYLPRGGGGLDEAARPPPSWVTSFPG